jgi:hypothetical protein
VQPPRSPRDGRPTGPPTSGYARQIFHRVCADWLAEQEGSTIFGVDANGPFVDHPDLERWQPAMAGDANLIGPSPRHHLTDALYRWLADRPSELEAIREARPQGPLAVSYRTTGDHRPCRYDHIYVTNDINVDNIEYRAPRADGSDHGAIVATLTTPEP